MSEKYAYPRSNFFQSLIENFRGFCGRSFHLFNSFGFFVQKILDPSQLLS